MEHAEPAEYCWIDVAFLILSLDSAMACLYFQITNFSLLTIKIRPGIGQHKVYSQWSNQLLAYSVDCRHLKILPIQEHSCMSETRRARTLSRSSRPIDHETKSLCASQFQAYLEEHSCEFTDCIRENRKQPYPYKRYQIMRFNDWIYPRRKTSAFFDSSHQYYLVNQCRQHLANQCRQHLANHCRQLPSQSLQIAFSHNQSFRRSLGIINHSGIRADYFITESGNTVPPSYKYLGQWQIQLARHYFSSEVISARVKKAAWLLYLSAIVLASCCGSVGSAQQMILMAGCTKLTVSTASTPLRVISMPAYSLASLTAACWCVSYFQTAPPGIHHLPVRYCTHRQRLWFRQMTREQRAICWSLSARLIAYIYPNMALSNSIRVVDRILYQYAGLVGALDIIKQLDQSMNNCWKQLTSNVVICESDSPRASKVSKQAERRNGLAPYD